MRDVIVSLLMILGLLTVPARAAGTIPAGYIVEISLTGEETKSGTAAVVRDKANLHPALMMPLFAGDAVSVNDPRSHITIETGGGKVIVVGAKAMRVEISGEIDTGDGAWSIIAAIGGVFAGDNDQAPENMVAKGGDLKIPMALRSGNLLLQGRRTLWLGWAGGEAPFAISLLRDGVETPLASGVTGNAVDLVLPGKMPERFALALRDGRQQQLQLRFRFMEQSPLLPGRMAGPPKTATVLLAQAAFLTGQADGAWTIEAAQALRAANSPAAVVLLARIQSGWKLQ